PTLPSRSGRRSCTTTSSHTWRGVELVVVSRIGSVPITVANSSRCSVTGTTLTTSAYSGAAEGAIAPSAPASACKSRPSCAASAGGGASTAASGPGAVKLLYAATATPPTRSAATATAIRVLFITYPSVVAGPHALRSLLAFPQFPAALQPD